MLQKIPVKQKCYSCGKEEGYPAYATIQTRSSNSFNICGNCFKRVKRVLDRPQEDKGEALKIPYKYKGYPFWNPMSGVVGGIYSGIILSVLFIIAIQYFT